MQYQLFERSEGVQERPSSGKSDGHCNSKPFKQQLLKWIGNKQRFAHEIIGYFPAYSTYHEPFLGSGGVLGTFAPPHAKASDSFSPLMQIWVTLKNDPEKLIGWYRERWELANQIGKIVGYERIKASYNGHPNGADFLYLTRSCYGGVVRFRKADGFMSTPCGAHNPVAPESFRRRAMAWHERVRNTEFRHIEYVEAMQDAEPDDLIYCDPPYSFSQAILYGAQNFSLENLFEEIGRCKNRGVSVALSIDGTKKSGNVFCDVSIPIGLFEREVSVNLGRSMLRRFQMGGQTLEKEVVSDRLLLTY